MRRWSASVQKATILRMLAGHERASEGDIILDRLNDTDLPPVCRGTAMMFQSYALFPLWQILVAMLVPPLAAPAT
jgi:putative spermidine/putrescine transport system ATP-binding protein